MPDSPRVLLAAGGTAGHIYPAVALARVLELRGVQCALVGSGGGMEERIAVEEGLEFFGVRTGKIDRSRPDPRALWRALMGFGDAVRVTRRFKPDLTVGFGGFASFPGVAGAWLTGTKLAMHEANALPGLVTRVFARSARFVALADEATKQHLPAEKCVWVGMPVREQRLEKSVALAQLGLEAGKATVLIMGGSQGSVRLNALLPPILERVLTGKNVQVLHQTGRGRLEEVAPRVAHLPWYRTTEYVDGVAAWSAADLGITRAGMSTIADAAFHGVPLVLVPLPSSAEDHQTKNAMSVATRGAGLWVPEADLERESASGLPGRLAEGILSCLEPRVGEAMRDAARRGSPEGAVQRLADAVFGTLNEGSSKARV
jgi:UDP-N-acetylglucosamine--N-acetylmuramyl-(pentapeptide) pyrophosphoryl-undecaprenol N-acetylglucosamine transferase